MTRGDRTGRRSRASGENLSKENSGGQDEAVKGCGTHFNGWETFDSHLSAKLLVDVGIAVDIDYSIAGAA
jgi:hypothetical protein